MGRKTNDSRLTVITISVVRHVPRASSGSFLVRTASQSQRGRSIINVKGAERIDPRLVSIKGFESSKGMDLEMS